MAGQLEIRPQPKLPPPPHFRRWRYIPPRFRRWRRDLKCSQSRSCSCPSSCSSQDKWGAAVTLYIEERESSSAFLKVSSLLRSAALLSSMSFAVRSFWLRSAALLSSTSFAVLSCLLLTIFRIQRKKCCTSSTLLVGQCLGQNEAQNNRD